MLNTSSACCCHNRQCSSTCIKKQERLPELVARKPQRTRQPQQSLCPPASHARGPASDLARHRTQQQRQPSCPLCSWAGKKRKAHPVVAKTSDKQRMFAPRFVRSRWSVPHIKRTPRRPAEGQPHRASRTRSRRHHANRNERSDEDETGVGERPCLPPSPPHTPRTKKKSKQQRTDRTPRPHVRSRRRAPAIVIVICIGHSPSLPRATTKNSSEEESSSCDNDAHDRSSVSNKERS